MLTAMLINITVHNFIFPVLASTSAACLHKTGFKQLKFQFLAVLMAQTAAARAAAADITTTSRFDYTGSQSAALIRLVSLRPYLPPLLSNILPMGEESGSDAGRKLLITVSVTHRRLCFLLLSKPSRKCNSDSKISRKINLNHVDAASS